MLVSQLSHNLTSVKQGKVAFDGQLLSHIKAFLKEKREFKKTAGLAQNQLKVNTCLMPCLFLTLLHLLQLQFEILMLYE